MKQILAASIASLLLVTANASLAGDVAAGKIRAASCSGCHGANGISAIRCGRIWPDRKVPTWRNS